MNDAQPPTCPLHAIALALPPELDQGRIAALAGLPVALAELPAEQRGELTFLRVWRAIMALTPDRTLPLTVGLRLPYGTYGVIDYLAGSCATVGAAFVQLERYFGIISTRFGWRCDRQLGAVTLVAAGVDPEERQVCDQFILGVTLGRFIGLAEEPLTFQSVALAMAEPRDTSVHERVFGCRVRYGAEHSRLVLTPRAWATRLTRHEPTLGLLLERYADRLLADLPSPDGLTPLRQVIRQALPDGSLTLERAARTLALSPRTLQRRLSEAGTTFQRVVEAERAAAARAYLREPGRAQSEVASLVGYAESSAFTRAFRRWTGMTPSRFRAQAGSPA